MLFTTFKTDIALFVPFLFLQLVHVYSLFSEFMMVAAIVYMTLLQLQYNGLLFLERPFASLTIVTEQLFTLFMNLLCC